MASKEKEAIRYLAIEVVQEIQKLMCVSVANINLIYGKKSGVHGCKEIDETIALLNSHDELREMTRKKYMTEIPIKNCGVFEYVFSFIEFPTIEPCLKIKSNVLKGGLINMPMELSNLIFYRKTETLEKIVIFDKGKICYNNLMVNKRLLLDGLDYDGAITLSFDKNEFENLINLLSSKSN